MLARLGAHCPRVATFVTAIAVASARSAQAKGTDAPVEVEARADRDAVPPPKDRSVAGSVIPAERLRAPGLRSSDVLRTQPGVAVTETGGYGELSTASIRGATAAQTPVYLAGIRLNDDVGGTTDLSTVPLWLLHRVEIYRSNAPIEADQLGIGGAIFFEPRIPRGPDAGAGVQAGSFGNRAVWGFGGTGNQRSAVLAGVRFERADNDYSYTNDRGTRFDSSDDIDVVRTNADARTLDAWGIGRIGLGRGHADVIVNDTEREQGIPGLAVFPSTRARGRLSRRIGAVRAEVPCDSRGACSIATSTAVLSSTTEFDDPLRELSLGATYSELSGLRATQAVRMNLRPTPTLRVSPALNASVESLGIDLAGQQSLRARRVSGRGAVSAHWAVSDAFGLHSTVSAECNGTSAGGRTPWSFPDYPTEPSALDACARVDPSGRVGVEVGPSEFTVLANLGRYVRVPTLSETYGISGAVRGNSELLPERGVTLDLGVRARHASDGTLFSRAYLDLFGFVRGADHLIAYQRSSLGYVRPFNLGSARILGAELLAGMRPLPFVLFELAGTALDPRDTSDDRLPNDVLPYQSRLTLVPRAEVEATPGGTVVQRVKTSVSYFFRSNRTADRAGLVIIPAQGFLDVDVEVAMFGEHLFARLRIANVLDQLRTDLVGYPLPSRAAYAALEARW
jgi:iron complex outermembrane receptor protein